MSHQEVLFILCFELFYERVDCRACHCEASAVAILMVKQKREIAASATPPRNDGKKGKYEIFFRFIWRIFCFIPFVDNDHLAAKWKTYDFIAMGGRCL